MRGGFQTRLLVLGGIVLALVPVASAALVDGVQMGLDDGVSGGAGGSGEEPNPQAPDVDKTLKEIKTYLEQDQGDGGGGNVPAPPGSDQGFDRIGEGVGEVLRENWAITLAVTAGLAASSVAGWLLASRYIDPKIALRNPQRSMLYGFVKGNPGVHLKQLSSEFRMKTSTVLWHVRKLEAADLIKSRKANGYRVFYPVSGGMEARQLSEAVTALSNENARTIFSFISQNPASPFRDVMARLPINAGTVRWHLKKLRKATLIEDAPEAGHGILRPTDLGLKALAQLQAVPGTQVVQVPVVSTGAAEPAKSEELELLT